MAFVKLLEQAQAAEFALLDAAHSRDLAAQVQSYVLDERDAITAAFVADVQKLRPRRLTCRGKGEEPLPHTEREGYSWAIMVPISRLLEQHKQLVDYASGYTDAYANVSAEEERWQRHVEEYYTAHPVNVAACAQLARLFDGFRVDPVGVNWYEKEGACLRFLVRGTIAPAVTAPSVAAPSVAGP